MDFYYCPCFNDQESQKVSGIHAALVFSQSAEIKAKKGCRKIIRFLDPDNS